MSDQLLDGLHERLRTAKPNPNTLHGLAVAALQREAFPPSREPLAERSKAELGGNSWPVRLRLALARSPLDRLIHRPERVDDTSSVADTPVGNQEVSTPDAEGSAEAPLTAAEINERIARVQERLTRETDPDVREQLEAILDKDVRDFQDVTTTDES